jgi:Short C-terminal domain
MAIYFVAAILGGIVCAFLATSQNRNPFGWFVIGFLLPLVGVILLFVLPDPASAGLAAPAAQPSTYVDDLKKLADLRDRGVLSAEEFDEKKRLILQQSERAPAAKERTVVPTAETPADDAEAKALLAIAQEHHFAKEFADAKREYQALVSRFPESKQAATARQQLINLRST